MNRHRALAVVAGLGILLQAGMIIVPSRSEPPAPSDSVGVEWVELNSAGKPVVLPASTGINARPIQPVRGLLFFRKMDLRSAGRDDVSALPGIDDPVASRIVDFRDHLGRPLTWRDLDRVPGIGEKTMQTLRRHVVVQYPPSSPSPARGEGKRQPPGHAIFPSPSKGEGEGGGERLRRDLVVP